MSTIWRRLRSSWASNSQWGRSQVQAQAQAQARSGTRSGRSQQQRVPRLLGQNLLALVHSVLQLLARSGRSQRVPRLSGQNQLLLLVRSVLLLPVRSVLLLLARSGQSQEPLHLPVQRPRARQRSEVLPPRAPHQRSAHHLPSGQAEQQDLVCLSKPK